MVRINRTDFVFENCGADNRDTQGQKNGQECAPESDVKIKTDAHLSYIAADGYNASGCNRRENCSREDSNLHGLPHTVLSRTRLPIPPRELENGPLKLLCQFTRARQKTR